MALWRAVKASCGDTGPESMSIRYSRPRVLALNQRYDVARDRRVGAQHRQRGGHVALPPGGQNEIGVGHGAAWDGGRGRERGRSDGGAGTCKGGSCRYPSSRSHSRSTTFSATSSLMSSIIAARARHGRYCASVPLSKKRRRLGGARLTKLSYAVTERSGETESAMCALPPEKMNTSPGRTSATRAARRSASVSEADKGGTNSW